MRRGPPAPARVRAWLVLRGGHYAECEDQSCTHNRKGLSHAVASIYERIQSALNYDATGLNAAFVPDGRLVILARSVSPAESFAPVGNGVWLIYRGDFCGTGLGTSRSLVYTE